MSCAGDATTCDTSTCCDAPATCDSYNSCADTSLYKGSGVSCTTIHPGFVESEIAQVDNEGRHDPSRKDPRPAKLMWSAEKAAKAMVGALHRRDREHVFTGHGKLAGFVGRHMPGVAHLLMTRNG